MAQKLARTRMVLFTPSARRLGKRHILSFKWDAHKPAGRHGLSHFGIAIVNFVTQA
jgi:hypothetical protein